LWEFLLELLASENCRSIITWTDKDRLEFKFLEPEEVAKRWGAFKNMKMPMNYEKLSRALTEVLLQKRNHEKGWYSLKTTHPSEHQTEKHCSTALLFKWLHLRISSTDLITEIHLVQHNKQQHRKVPLSSFHLNGHTLGFYLQTQKL